MGPSPALGVVMAHGYPLSPRKGRQTCRQHRRNHGVFMRDSAARDGSQTGVTAGGRCLMRPWATHRQRPQQNCGVAQASGFDGC
jgi:phosphoribosylamine-glycine ligase